MIKLYVMTYIGDDIMLFFNKKVDEKIINEIEDIIKTHLEELESCFMPVDAKIVWYLGGNELLDTLYQNELENFDLDTLFNSKKTSLPECLREHSKVRKSFFFALNNIKQNKNLFYNDALCKFLKEEGKFFINSYLKNFEKYSKKYRKLLEKNKLPEYKELCVWIQDDNLCFIDRLFVYLHNYKINVNNIVKYYQDENIARTVLIYTENGVEKKMFFNLSSFDNLKTLLPLLSSECEKDC